MKNYLAIFLVISLAGCGQYEQAKVPKPLPQDVVSRLCPQTVRDADGRSKTWRTSGETADIQDARFTRGDIRKAMRESLNKVAYFVKFDKYDSKLLEVTLYRKTIDMMSGAGAIGGGVEDYKSSAYYAVSDSQEIGRHGFGSLALTLQTESKIPETERMRIVLSYGRDRVTVESVFILFPPNSPTAEELGVPHLTFDENVSIAEMRADYLELPQKEVVKAQQNELKRRLRNLN